MSHEDKRARRDFTGRMQEASQDWEACKAWWRDETLENRLMILEHIVVTHEDQLTERMSLMAQCTLDRLLLEVWPGPDNPDGNPVPPKADEMINQAIALLRKNIDSEGNGPQLAAGANNLCLAALAGRRGADTRVAIIMVPKEGDQAEMFLRHLILSAANIGLTLAMADHPEVGPLSSAVIRREKKN